MPRLRTFDEEALLDAAIELFWVRGYSAVALADLSIQTKVTNGSLYQAYGSKWSLFLAAYRRYCAGRVAVVAAVFDTKNVGVERTVNAYLDAIIDDCLSHPDRRGCLMLNTISEFGTDSDIEKISGEAVGGMERAVALGLRRVAPGGTPQATIDDSAAYVVALSQALIQLFRVGRDPADLRRIGGQVAASTDRLLCTA